MKNTTQELLVLDHLAKAWNEYLKLEIQHPDDQRTFRDAIHAAQGRIAIRLARKSDPEIWRTYNIPQI